CCGTCRWWSCSCSARTCPIGTRRRKIPGRRGRRVRSAGWPIGSRAACSWRTRRRKFEVLRWWGGGRGICPSPPHHPTTPPPHHPTTPPPHHPTTPPCHISQPPLTFPTVTKGTEALDA